MKDKVIQIISLGEKGFLYLTQKGRIIKGSIPIEKEKEVEQNFSDRTFSLEKIPFCKKIEK